MSDTGTAVSGGEKLLERGNASAQDSPAQRMLSGAGNAKRARHRAKKKAAQKLFSERLCAAMTQSGLSASQLARQIWGTEKTRRGTMAAKNRDRVGAYMKGLAYPNPESMKKLADGIGIPVEELVPPRPRERQPRGVARKPAATAQTATARQPLLSINMLPGTQHARLQMDQVVPMELAIDIAQRINALTAVASTSTAATPPQLGTVVK
jgi:transcriptional regulator with XRE-family HTH domain